MISNIIDNRKRPYRWRKINARIEPVWHDNSCKDSDQSEIGTADSIYEELLGVSVSEAVAWALASPDPVTLYLGDDGDHLETHELSEISNRPTTR